MLARNANFVNSKLSGTGHSSGRRALSGGKERINARSAPLATRCARPVCRAAKFDSGLIVLGAGEGLRRERIVRDGRIEGLGFSKKKLTSDCACYSFRETLPKFSCLSPIRTVGCAQTRSYEARLPRSFDIGRIRGQRSCHMPSPVTRISRFCWLLLAVLCLVAVDAARGPGNTNLAQAQGGKP